MLSGGIVDGLSQDSSPPGQISWRTAPVSRPHSWHKSKLLEKCSNVAITMHFSSEAFNVFFHTGCNTVTCVCSGFHGPSIVSLRKEALLAVWRARSNQAKPHMRATSCLLTKTCTPTSMIQPTASSLPAQILLTMLLPSSQKIQPLKTALFKAQC